MPVISAAFINSRAWFTAFCPVVASSTNSTSRSEYGSSRSIMRYILASSSIRFFLLWSLPAVSHIRTSALRAFDACMASYITAPGSEPSCCAIMSTPARSAHSVSCSIAAALNVSAAARITFFPCALSPAAILPIEVVLPTPLTPITRSTDLRFSYS